MPRVVQGMEGYGEGGRSAVLGVVHQVCPEDSVPQDRRETGGGGGKVSTVRL